MNWRVPPHSLETERALLGCVLLEPPAYALVEGLVCADDFYGAAHATVWASFGLLAATSRPIDQLTVRDTLHQQKKLAHVGGDEFLLSLTDTLPTSEHAESYAKRITELANRRRLIEACTLAASRGYDMNIESRDFIASTETSILGAVRDTAGSQGLVHISGPLTQVFERMQRIAESKTGDGVTGLRTGIHELDRWTTGMHPGELIIVAGRPGMGKSALMSDLILAGARQAAESGGCIATFSLEMQSEIIAARLAVAHAGIDLRAMRAARLDARAMTALVRTVETLHRSPIYVDETAALSIASIRSRARRLRARTPLKLIVVDYLQLMSGTRKGMSREEIVAEAARGGKELAKEMGCPVVALAQLNRDVEKRPDKRPQLADLRESGEIEQAADTVLMLYRRGYYAAMAAKNKADPRAPKSDIEAGEDDGVAEIIMAKVRNGPPGSVHCRFDATSAHFVNLERDDDEGLFGPHGGDDD